MTRWLNNVLGAFNIYNWKSSKRNTFPQLRCFQNKQIELPNRDPDETFPKVKMDANVTKELSSEPMDQRKELVHTIWSRQTPT